MTKACKQKKCAKPGKTTRNCFFNFLRCYRQQNCGLSITEIAKRGAKEWNCMSEQDKCKYMKEAANAPPFKRRKRKRKCSKKPSVCKYKNFFKKKKKCGRSRSRSRKRSRSRSRSRGCCRSRSSRRRKSSKKRC